MDSISINNISVTDYGSDKAPLIFVHAFPLDSNMWRKQVNYFEDKFRVITYDVRGMGKSFYNNSNVYTMETFADDLISIIKKLKLEQVNVCGLSMGGYITLRAYQKEPALFSKLILADTKAGNDDNKGLIARSEMINKLQTEGKNFLITDFMPKLISETGSENADLVDELKEIIISQETVGISKAVGALATRIDHEENLDKINIPVLIIIGEHDKLTPIENSNKMKSLIPNSKLELIKDAGHISNMENPKEFNKVISEFLNN